MFTSGGDKQNMSALQQDQFGTGMQQDQMVLQQSQWHNMGSKFAGTMRPNQLVPEQNQWQDQMQNQQNQVN